MDVPRLESCVPVPLPDAELAAVVCKAKDWALMHGVGMRSKANYDPDALHFAPFALTPSSFPRSEFRKAVEMQPILNELTHRVAHDAEFLRESLASTLPVDPFTAELFRIWETVSAEGVAQPTSLGMLRSDIMLETKCPNAKKCKSHSPYCCWKQVEINSIASGFGHLGPVSRAVQSFVLHQLGHSDKIENLPPNEALSGLCEGLTDAWDLFGAAGAVVLFVVEDTTYNICDQRFHEFEIYNKRPDVRVIRKTLTQIGNQGRLDDKKRLIIEGDPVAVVYFRAGYEPGHYPTRKEWDARLLMERSTAIKSPSVQYHLAGTKKVQQSLARPNVLERFIKDSTKAEKVREIFTGLYSLDLDEFGDEAAKMAIENAERYVMKPQREGGGNNIYGSDIKTTLERMGRSEERSAYILMERISPPICRGYIVRPGQTGLPAVADLVSELGIFGVIIGTPTEIFSNTQVGHMLRTKLSHVDEGGVAAGLGALDSPYLIDT